MKKIKMILGILLVVIIVFAVSANTKKEPNNQEKVDWPWQSK